MRTLVLLVIAGLSGPAVAGPSGANRLEPFVELVFDEGGVWAVGYDLCTQQKTAVWYGPGLKPKTPPVLETNDEALLAHASRDQRASIRAIAKLGTTAFAVGDHGMIIATTDGGASWSVQRSGTAAGFAAVTAISTRDAFAAAWSGLFATHDGGKSWHQVVTSKADFRAVWGYGRDVYAVGFESFVSHDGGKTWAPLSITPGEIGGAWVGGTNDTDVYIIGRQVRRSADHGKTWDPLKPAETTPLLDFCRTTGPGGFGPYDCCASVKPRPGVHE